MDAKVVIENWIFVPVIIAIIALVISLYSIYLTRENFVKSNRPYVWASNYKYLDHESNTLCYTPLNIACNVRNSPARIIQTELKMNLNMETLIVQKEKNTVRFLDEMYEWRFDMSREDFQRIKNRAYKEKSELVRVISLKYSSLNGGKRYNYILEQSFNISKGEWININEKTD